MGERRAGIGHEAVCGEGVAGRERGPERGPADGAGAGSRTMEGGRVDDAGPGGAAEGEGAREDAAEQEGLERRDPLRDGPFASCGITKG